MMTRCLLIGVGVVVADLMTVGLAAAQTIRPLVSEYPSEARGRLELVNEGDRPLNVVIEPRGFSLAEHGEMRDEPLNPGIQLKFASCRFDGESATRAIRPSSFASILSVVVSWIQTGGPFLAPPSKLATIRSSRIVMAGSF